MFVAGIKLLDSLNGLNCEDFVGKKNASKSYFHEKFSLKHCIYKYITYKWMSWRSSNNFLLKSSLWGRWATLVETLTPLTGSLCHLLPPAFRHQTQENKAFHSAASPYSPDTIYIFLQATQEKCRKLTQFSRYFAPWQFYHLHPIR